MRRFCVLVLALSGCAGVDCCQPVAQVPVQSYTPMVILRAPTSEPCESEIVSRAVESAPVAPSSPSPFNKGQGPALEPLPKNDLKPSS